MPQRFFNRIDWVIFETHYLNTAITIIEMQKITLLIHCKDQKGIIAAVTNYIASIDGNIVYLDQHVDEDEDVFFYAH